MSSPLAAQGESFRAIDAAGNVATLVIAYTVAAGSSSPVIVFPDPGGEWV